MINFVFQISGDAIPFFNRVNSMASEAERKDHNGFIAVEAENLTRFYLKNLNRHDTANRLGAKPQQVFADAADSVESSVGNAFASVSISHPVIGRAFHDRDIKPKKKYLTIPVNAAAYGRRAGEFDDLIFVRNTPSGTPILARKVDGSGEMLETMYVLVKGVHQDQDRTLLPSDDQYGEAMERGTAAYVKKLSTV